MISNNAIEQIHEYILDGDVFQVNLSRGWHGQFAERPMPLRFTGLCVKITPRLLPAWCAGTILY